MRSIVWFALLFGLAVGLALFAETNQSNVVIFYPPYRIDLSLNLFVLLLAAVFLVLHGLLRVAEALRVLPLRASAYRRGLRMHRAMLALRDAIASLDAGRFGRAEKLAAEARAWPELADVAALVAARATHNLQEYARRDGWLAQANSAETTQAKLVAQAGMQAESRDADGAIETIAGLQAQGMRQIQVQRIALRARQQLRDWAEVLRLARLLDKRKALHPVVVARTKQQAIEGLLDERRHDADALLALWRTLTAAERHAPGNAERVAGLLIGLERHASAQAIIEEALADSRDERLLLRYADLAGPGVPALPLIGQVERWLRERPGDPTLHYVLGRLCQRQQLWGKARASLQTCLDSSRGDDGQSARLRLRAHLALAELNEELERGDAAAIHYREAARLATARLLR